MSSCRWLLGMILFLTCTHAAAQRPAFDCSAREWNKPEYRYHNWMGQVKNAINDETNWNRLRLGELSVAGSHDAGIHWSDPDDPQYVTQSFDICEQLCRGVRFFDIRLKKFKGTTWRTLHPGFGGLNGWADSWDETVVDMKQFLDHADHADEVIYIRIKLVAEKSELAQHRRDLEQVLTRDDTLKTPSLKPWLVQKINGNMIMKYSMGNLFTARRDNGAKVVLMAYKWGPRDQVPADQVQTVQVQAVQVPAVLVPAVQVPAVPAVQVPADQVQVVPADQVPAVQVPADQVQVVDFVFEYSERTVHGEYANTDKRVMMFPSQFKQIQKWSAAKALAERLKEDDSEWIMQVTYLTLTNPLGFGNIRALATEHLGGPASAAAGKNDYLINDFLVLSIYNFGSPGNVVMTDFCGDPNVWGGARFKGTAHAGTQSLVHADVGALHARETDGNALVAALMAYNLATVKNVSFIRCADAERMSVCGEHPNMRGLLVSGAETAKGSRPKGIPIEGDMIRNPRQPPSNTNTTATTHTGL